MIKTRKNKNRPVLHQKHHLSKQSYRKQSIVTGTRNKAWKRKATCLSKQKKICPGRPKIKSNVGVFAKKRLFVSPKKSCRGAPSPQRNTLLEAQRRSMISFRARHLLYESHTRNLNILLFSNGLKRIEIEGDGNCFFNAIHSTMPSLDNGNILLQIICDHLESNFENYSDFLVVLEEQNNEQRKLYYNQRVIFLRGNGNWSSERADALPLAAANTLKREIMILSSDRERPILKIQPSLTSAWNDEHIALALTAIPGFEHYDGCKALDEDCDMKYARKQENNRTPKKVQNETVNLTPKKTITPRKQANY